MTDPRLLAACESELPWLLDVITTLVERESPSTDGQAVDRCGLEVATKLEELGARIDVIEQSSAGNHVRAEIGNGPRQVLVLGHLDTVWPVGQLAQMPVRTIEGRLHGPGVYDMKAGIGLAMLALRVLSRLDLRPSGRLVLLFTSDEETGSATGRPVLEAEARKSSTVLVLEPPLPGGGLKTARKGVGVFTVEAHGKSAHAGIEPERGANAVVEIAHQIVAICRARHLSPGVTVTPGVVAGGTRANVVPDRARVEVDVRIVTADDARRLEQVFSELRARVPGVSLQVTGGISRPPLERSPAVVALYEQAKRLAAEMGRELAEGATGGASDGNFTASCGVPTLDGLGAIGGGAHALDEHVVVAELPWRAALLAGLMLRLLK